MIRRTSNFLCQLIHREAWALAIKCRSPKELFSCVIHRRATVGSEPTLQPPSHSTLQLKEFFLILYIIEFFVFRKVKIWTGSMLYLYATILKDQIYRVLVRKNCKSVPYPDRNVFCFVYSLCTARLWQWKFKNICMYHLEIPNPLILF